MFREIETGIGTHDFCILVLDALINAFAQYRFTSQDQFNEQFENIFDLIRNVKPRYAVLIDSLYKIAPHIDSTASKEELIRFIESIKTEYEIEMVLMQEATRKIKANGKNILIYDHSHSVQHALESLKNMGQKFTLLIAEQDLQKTSDSITFAYTKGIPYKVVPSYMLSYLDETVDMAFFGAVTLQHGGKFVMDPGSKSIISHLHLEKKPIYVFLTTSKFSLWTIESPQKKIYVKSHMRKHHQLSEIVFERIKFSHDRVDLNLVDYTVTEKGIYTPKELQHEYDELKLIRDKEKRKRNLD